MVLKFRIGRTVSIAIFLFMQFFFMSNTHGKAEDLNRFQAYIEPFFIQYEDKEILAENNMITMNGESYFPLIDVVKMLNGELNVVEGGYNVSFSPLEQRSLQTTGVLPKTQINTETPTFNETVHARAAAIIENSADQLMFSKNGHEKLYPASTTKIMTALIALEKGNLNELVTVSHEVKNIPSDSSKAFIQPGDQLTLEQLLYAMMVPSGNDAAVAVAAHIAGSEKEFVKMMNEKASEIGATNTNFINPHGYHDPNQYTTVVDLAKIAYQASKYEEFFPFVSTPKYTITYKQRNGNYITKTWRATNQQIRKETSNYSPLITGGKTGYTSASRHTLVSFAHNEGNQYITVILKGDRSQRYADTLRLVQRAIQERKDHDNKYKQTVSLSYNNKSIYVNHEKINANEKFFTYQGRLYIPVDTIELLSDQLESVAIAQTKYKVALDHFLYPFINDLLYYKDGRLYFPVRPVVDSLKFSIFYHKDTGEITLTKDQFEVILGIDSRLIKVNGSSYELDDAPFILKGVTYAPIRLIGEHFVDKFDWGVGKTLLIR